MSKLFGRLVDFACPGAFWSIDLTFRNENRIVRPLDYHGGAELTVLDGLRFAVERAIDTLARAVVAAKLPLNGPALRVPVTV